MKKAVKKAVFPVAGLGTRFLPATKVSPKEMLPIVDKPLIQFAVEEALEAGITEMVFVTGRTKNVIMDHFDKAYELETELEKRGKDAILKQVQSILPSYATCIFIRQAEALGLGHAVNCAKSVVGDEPFAVILADDLIINEDTGGVKQMVKIFEERQCSVLGVERVPQEDTQSYGIVKATPVAERLSGVDLIVEKPKPEAAPSNLAVVGRYILTPAIFDKIAGIGRGAGGEIQLTDAIAALLKDETVLAYEFHGKRYDCGSKLGYLMATVEQGLKHPEVGVDFLEYLENLKLN